MPEEVQEGTVMNSWWGYLHVNGSIQVKRAFVTVNVDIYEADQSDFVQRTTGVFMAKNREQALAIARSKLL